MSVDDGTWATDPQPTPRAAHCAIYDPLRERMIVFGGDGNDVWVLELNGEPTWTRLETSGVPPSFRAGQSGVYDSRRDRLLVFGGSTSGGIIRNDVWALSLSGTPTWTKLNPTGPLPPARWRHAAIYDPARDRLVIFGGSTSDGQLNDVWALSLAGSLAWMPIVPTGTPPVERYGPGAVYDPVRDRLIAFGGTGLVNGVLTNLNDVWAVPLAGTATWTALAPGGIPPEGRQDACVIYDPIRDRVVVFAGAGGAAVPKNDCWGLSLSGTPTWQSIAASGPLPEIRTQASAIYDSSRDRMVVFGGYGAFVALSDAWSLALDATPRWLPLRAPPHPRSGHRAVLDSKRNRMIVFGDMVTSDVWALSLAGPPVWTPLAPAGVPPVARIDHTAVYDAARDRVLIFGGYGDSRFLNDVWSLSLSGVPTWEQLSPAGAAPSPRELHSAIYDPIRDRMLVFGGFDGSPLNDLWELSPTGGLHWASIVPSSTPPPIRDSHQAIYDPVRDRMVVFGGVASATSPYSDVWAMTLAGSPEWQQLTPIGTPMEGRWGHTAVYDSKRDRMVVFGGVGPLGSLNYDTWELTFDDEGTWTPLSRAGVQPNPVLDHSAIYDVASDRMIVFGGSGPGSVIYDDLWTLEWNSTVGVSPIMGGDVRLSPAYPDPTAGPVSIEFTLATPGPASVRVYDASGRWMRTLLSGVLPAGRHSVRWDGQLASAGHAPAGIYFCELSAAGKSIASRFVLLR